MRRLHELVLEHDEIADLDPARRRLALRALVSQLVPDDDVAPIVASLAEDIDGFGRLSGLMRDDAVTDILVNGPHEVWVERAGALELTAVAFDDRDDLGEWIERLLDRAGVRADVGRPVADGRLEDGSRLHVVLPPVAPAGPVVSIRRFPTVRFGLDDLRDRRLLDRHEAELLESLVRERKSVAISGATGSGKTTLLNALIGVIGSDERVVLVEETPELNPTCPHFVSLVARPANLEGRGEIDLATLVRAALRMRPDRIVVGEVRGPEAWPALGALSTGHAGSMITVHASSAADALERLVALALQSRGGATESTLRAQVRRAFTAVVHLERGPEGRRVREVLQPG